MKRFALWCILLFTISKGIAQRNYFIYIEGEASQAFFIKLDDRMYNSSSGYLILSKLKDTVYNFTIGFPGNKWPEQKFVCNMRATDHGYLLKNFDEKGWGLFDLKTSAVQMGTLTSVNSVPDQIIQVNAFTDMLSKAADDSTLRYKAVVAVAEKNEIKQPEPTQPKKDEPSPASLISKADEKTAVKDEPVTKKEEPVTETKQTNIVKADDTKPSLPEPNTEKHNVEAVENYFKSTVIKKSESSTTEGFGLVFIDRYNDGKEDTIRLLIPADRQQQPAAKPEVKKEKKFLDISSDTQKTANISPQPISEKTNNCREVAGENDFLKLRKKMAAESNEDDMISEAKKYYRSKCFTTEQIKNLSALFLTNSGKYAFFKASYLSISDLENFAALASEIRDEYFLNQFKAMLRN